MDLQPVKPAALVMASNSYWLDGQKSFMHVRCIALHAVLQLSPAPLTTHSSFCHASHAQKCLEPEDADPAHRSLPELDFQ